MTDTQTRADIHAADIVAFLADHRINATRVVPYVDGIASRNFRATGPKDIDLTIRCDLRRSLCTVREDARYADLAATMGVRVPPRILIEGHIKDVATTVRSTIDGISLSHASACTLPQPCRIGQLLATLHNVSIPSGGRAFFYQGILDSADPLWRSFEEARAVFDRDSEISGLMDQAIARLSHHALLLRSLTKMSQVLIHGDFDPPNILTSGAELILIDWEKACAGYAVADLVQAIYYFCGCYARGGLPFVEAFVRSYSETQFIPWEILDVWLLCFPAFIFLRDTVSASIQPANPIGSVQKLRFHSYLRNDSAPRFRYFVSNEADIRGAVLAGQRQVVR